MLKFSFIKCGGNFVFKTACVQGMEQLQEQAIKNNMFKISRFKIASIMVTLMNQGYPLGLTSCSFHLPIIHFGEAVCITQPMDKKHFGTCFWIRQAYHNIPSGNIPSSLSKTHHESVSSVHPSKYCINMSILQTGL